MERFLIRKFATASSSEQETTTTETTTNKKQKTKNDECIKWRTLHASLLLRQDTSCPNKNANKIACFDLDETLQKTKSGKKPFLTHENDFTFRDASVRTALNALHENGYKIVIFSNQGMVKSAVDGKKAEQIRKRIEILSGELGEAKFDFYAATQSGEKDVKGYRKPNVGMWREMLSRRREKIQEEEKLLGNEKKTSEDEITSTFYVGDAANRPQDHSDADIAFARNCNVEFFLPEQFFEGGAFRKFLRQSRRLETDKDDDEEETPKEETKEEKQKGVPRGD